VICLSSQMLRGIIEGCILAIIDRQEVYGYEISERLAEYGFTSMSEGTIYPLLLRMQREELVTSQMKKSTAGPRRKYYYLTGKGKEELEDFIVRWARLEKNVNNVLRNQKESK